MKRTMHLFTALFLALAIGAAALAGDGVPVAVIIHTNDVHGCFAASDTAIGHDRVAAIVRETRRRVPATILLDAGDAVQGAALVKWNKGEAAIDIMNAAGYDGMALGNHEFDYGWNNIVALLRAAEFPFFTQPVVSEGIAGFEAAALYERGGRRFGVFGITTPETKQSSGGGFGKRFGDTDDIVAYADAMAYSLRRAGAEVVVCLAHLGVDDQGFITSRDLRDRVDGIDVIVDGHSHTPLAEIEQAEGRALIVSTGEHGESIGVVEFHCVDGRIRPYARSISKAEADDVVPDPVVAGVIAKWTAESEARNSKIIAWSPVALGADRLVVRTREAELGNLMADAMRAATTCDAALINGGNIRAPLPAGDLTAGAVDAILPYDSTVVTAKIRGGVLKEALEHSVSRYPGEFGGFLQVSGLSFAFDPGRPAGKRVTGVKVGGKPLHDDQLYAVAVCDWIAAGGDGYEMLEGPFKAESGEEVLALIDVFIRHLEQNGDIVPAIEGRIVAATPGN